MLGTTLPTPLYDIYQAQWHFSAAIVTVTFAVYAAGVLLSLLLTGRASDQAVRKLVLAAALGCSALSTVVFILAPNVGVLMAGRILSGVSAGLMTGTATATLTELIPASGRRPGLAGGPVGRYGVLAHTVASSFLAFWNASLSAVAGVPRTEASRRATSSRADPAAAARSLSPGDGPQDAVDMLLRRALGAVDPAADALVGRALGHQREHIALSRRPA